MRSWTIAPVGALLILLVLLIQGSAIGGAEAAQSISGPAAPLAERLVITSSSRLTIPTIDGRLETAEWADAASHDISSAHFSATLLLKDDAQYLYVGIAALSDTTFDDGSDPQAPVWDDVRLLFDAGDDLQLLSDWRVRLSAIDVPAAGVIGPVGLGQICGDQYFEQNLGAIGDSQGYLEYELKIPLQVGEGGLQQTIVGAPGSTSGLLLQLGDKCMAGGCTQLLWFPHDATVPWYYECDDHEPSVATWARLQLASENPDPNEPNDALGQATALAPGVVHGGYICGRGDKDYYEFTAAAGMTATVDLQGGGAGNSLPAGYDLVLYDASGVEVARTETSGLDPDQIVYAIPSDGQWYVRVWGGPGGQYDCLLNYYLAVTLEGGDPSGHLGLSSPFLMHGDSQYVHATVLDPLGRRITESLDLTVTVGAEPLLLYDDGTHGDLEAADGTYAAWYSDTVTGTHAVSLYLGTDLLDSNSFTVIDLRYAPLIVLTNLSELYDEFLETGTAPGEDRDGDGIIDFYQLLDRVYDYAKEYFGIVYDTSQQIAGYDWHANRYGISWVSRSFLGEYVDQFIHDVVERSDYPPNYVALLGDPQVVPPRLVEDQKDLERNYYDDRTWRSEHPNLSDSSQDLILSDLPFATITSTVPGYQDGFSAPEMAVGRVFAAHPDELISAIDKYEQPITISTTAILAQNPVCWTKETSWFGFGSDQWLEKQGGDCKDPNFPATAAHLVDQLDDYLSASDIYSRTGDPYNNGGATDPWSYQDFRQSLRDNDVTYVLAHAEHSGQDDASGSNLDRQDYTSQPVTLTQRLVVNGGCHAGYATAWEGSRSSVYEEQMVLAAMKRGVTYVGSTVYTIFSHSHIDYPSLEFEGAYWAERWLNLFTQQLNTALTIGQALQASIVAYGSQCGTYDASDEHNLYGLALYGLPTQGLRHPASTSQAQVMAIDRTAGTASIAGEMASGGLSTITVDVPLVYTSSVGTDETLFKAFGAGYATDSGRPVVPQLIRVHRLPVGQEVIGLELTEGSASTLPGTYQPLIAAAMTEEGLTVEPDFAATGTFPPQPYSWSVRQTEQETNLVLAVYPVQWDLDAGAVRVTDRLAFQLETSGTVPAGPVQVLGSGVGTGSYAVGQTIPVTLALQASTPSQVELDVRLLDLGGNLRHQHVEDLSVLAGSSTVAYDLPTGRSQAGPRLVEVLVRDTDPGHLLYGALHPVQLRGLVLSAWLAQSHLEPEAAGAELRAEVRDEGGALVPGLSEEFSLSLDGQPQAATFVAAGQGYYTATVSLAGLNQGYHSLALACSGQGRSSNVEHLTMLFGSPLQRIYLPLILRQHR